MSFILQFYRNQRKNDYGQTIEDIMQYSYGEMEFDHNYIQLIFPSNEPSMCNVGSPVLTEAEAETFQSDPKLQETVTQSFIKFIGFLGLQFDGDVVSFRTDRENPYILFEKFNHNMLRVTRMLKSLRLVGLEKLALATWNGLQPVKSMVNAQTWAYWENAVFGPLWG